jgi:hypothetical protein
MVIAKMLDGKYKCLGCGRVHPSEIEAIYCGCGFD